MKINNVLQDKISEITKILKGFNNPIKDYYVHKRYYLDRNYNLVKDGYHIVDLNQKMIFSVSSLSEKSKINEIIYDINFVSEYINSVYKCDRLASFVYEPNGIGNSFYIEQDDLYLRFNSVDKFQFQSGTEYYRDLKLRELL